MCRCGNGGDVEMCGCGDVGLGGCGGLQPELPALSTLDTAMDHINNGPGKRVRKGLEKGKFCKKFGKGMVVKVG